MKKSACLLRLSVVLALLCILNGCTGKADQPEAPPEDAALPLKGKVIALDPGHGGHDMGAVGSQGVPEAILNLSIAENMKDRLEELGAEVIMTRTGDTVAYAETGDTLKQRDMLKRVEIINQSEPDIALSIHMNIFGESKYRGTQLFYYPGSVRGEQLADQLSRRIEKELKQNYGRKSQTDDTLYILKKTNCTCVLVECGFLSNPEEEALLLTQAYQEELSSALCQGIIDYFNK